MSYRWKQIKKCLDIGDEILQTKSIFEKNYGFLQTYKYINIKQDNESETYLSDSSN